MVGHAVAHHVNPMFAAVVIIVPRVAIFGGEKFWGKYTLSLGIPNSPLEEGAEVSLWNCPVVSTCAALEMSSLVEAAVPLVQGPTVLD